MASRQRHHLVDEHNVSTGQGEELVEDVGTSARLRQDGRARTGAEPQLQCQDARDHAFHDTYRLEDSSEQSRLHHDAGQQPMLAVKLAVSLLLRFILSFALIASVWITSTHFRVGPFLYDGIGSDFILFAASLGLLVGTLGLYRSGRISAVLMYLASVIIITVIDHLWGVYGYVDAYKSVQYQVLYPAVAAIAISPIAFLFRAKSEARASVLARCWAALILTMFLIGSHVFGLLDVIGPTYIAIVFLCLAAAEGLRQYRHWKAAHGV
jgi:hypothetical protein